MKNQIWQQVMETGAQGRGDNKTNVRILDVYFQQNCSDITSSV